MTEDTDYVSLVGTILLMLWALGGFVFILGLSAVSSSPYVVVYIAIVFEWLLSGMTGVLYTGADESSGVSQREQETNGRFLARIWLTVHVFLLKLPVLLITRAPKAGRQTVEWLRKSPEGNHD